VTNRRTRVGPRRAGGCRFQRVLPAVLLIGAIGALVISVPAAGVSRQVGVVDSTSTPDVASTSVPETVAPATSEPVATDTATTDPAITDPGTTEPGVTDPSPSVPATSEPTAVSSTPAETSVDAVVETSEPATTIEAAPVAVSLTPSMSLFPDADGNFTNDDDEIAYAGESSGVTASVTVVNAAPDPLGAISIAAPNGESPGEWSKIDVDAARVLLPTGVTAQIRITFDDGSTVTEHGTSSGPIPILTGGSPVASLVVTFHGSLEPDARVGLDVHGTLNDSVGDEDLPSGRSPGIGACASIAGGRSTTLTFRSATSAESSRCKSRTVGLGCLPPCWPRGLPRARIRVGRARARFRPPDSRRQRLPRTATRPRSPVVRVRS